MRILSLIIWATFIISISIITANATKYNPICLEHSKILCYGSSVILSILIFFISLLLVCFIFHAVIKLGTKEER